MLYSSNMRVVDPKEQDFIEELYNRYAQTVKAVSDKILGEAIDSDDIVNDTFMKVIEYRSKFEEVSEEYRVRLIVIVAQNICRNLLKRMNRIKFTSIDNYIQDEKGDYKKLDVPDEIDVSEIVVRADAVERAKTAIETFPSPSKEMLMLKFFYNMRNKEIAEIYGMNQSTVNTIIHRSIKKLRNTVG